MSTAFRIQLDNTQEVPDTTSSATGLGTVVFDSNAVTATYEFTITGLDFGPLLGLPSQTPGIDDDVGGVHVHNAARGVNGPVVFGQRNPSQDNDDLVININPDGTTTFSGIWETTDPPNGANPELADFAATLAAATQGSDAPLYWNIHTEQFPGGEIRGQWVCIATDNAETVAGTDGDDFLPGLGGNDTLTGGLGDDELDGGAGADRMEGGGGNDTYVVDNGGDQTIEANIGGSIDLVRSSVSFSIASQFVENLTLTGSADINATGNNLNNVLTGNAGENILTGALGNDTYFVNNTGDQVVEANVAGSVDTVNSSVSFSIASHFVENLTLTGSGNIDATGNNLNNVLTGNAGQNTLTGALGNDTYFVNNTGDQVVEANVAGSVDTVNSSVSFSIASQFVENLTLTGSGNTNATGNNLNNVLTGNAGQNTLTGALGNDTYFVNNTGDRVVEADVAGSVDTVNSSVSFSIASQFVENLTLTGSGNNNATGNNLNNVLTGNAGENTLTGALGNDTYFVNNTGDEVVEANVAGSVDTVNSSVSFSIASQFVENLTLTGSGSNAATGNNLNNVLTGNTGENPLTGALGNDTLNGGVGGDRMDGGGGNDTYLVDNSGDETVEADVAGSVDTVNSSVSFSIASQFVENLTLTGSGNNNATGNNLNNVLTGNSGENTLTGGVGNDALNGGGGADTFVFDDGHGADVVQDFANDSDEFDLTAVAAVDEFSDLAIDGSGVGVTVSYGTGSFNIANIENTALLDAGDFAFA